MMKFLVLEPEGLALTALECPEDGEVTCKTMQKAVDGNFESISWLFPELPEYVDVWCNEECLFRPDLLPILSYRIQDRSGCDHALPIFGNLLFTAYNEQGETLGLSELQIEGIQDMLGRVPIVGAIRNDTCFPMLFIDTVPQA